MESTERFRFGTGRGIDDRCSVPLAWRIAVEFAAAGCERGSLARRARVAGKPVLAGGFDVCGYRPVRGQRA